ncbi:MAG: hypothetical protein FWD72_04220, partial [Eggerthellaceae bacterium]|nr:hypothetical protein [Eggerthellaceae bacterium]
MADDRKNQRYPSGEDTDNIYCAFCGKSPRQVAAMIAGPGGIYICDECISICSEAMMRDLGIDTQAGYMGGSGASG